MDTWDAREADLEELAHAVAVGAAELSSWVHDCTTRQRLTSRSQRIALGRWATRAHEQASWLRAREQAEVDRESRRCARRMADEDDRGDPPELTAH